MHIAYDYVVAYRTLHLAALCDSAPQRLAQVLSQLAKGMGHRVADGMELHIRNEELANEAHVTIFTVSRLMREWQRQGLVRKGRGRSPSCRNPIANSRSRLSPVDHDLDGLGGGLP